MKGIELFRKKLLNLKSTNDDIERTKKITNTKMQCLGIKTPVLNDIANNIYINDYVQFLKIWPWKYYEETIIIGKILSKIKDFHEVKKYLVKYSQMADNWSTIDTLKFNFTVDNKELFFNFAKELIKSGYIFSRRLGLIILLKMTNFQEYSDDILQISDSLKQESAYYVNMANAWLIAEMFIKYRDKTYQLFKDNNLNKFTNNKAISKCIDSFRVNENDKFLLKSFRIK